MSSAHANKTTGTTVVNSHAVKDDLTQNLRRLDRLASLGLIAASVAHEIKNGLTAINTFTQVLLEKNDDREMAEVVQRELKRIDSLVTQMLRYASPKPVALGLVQVHHLLDYSLRLMESQMSVRTICLKRDYRAKPGTVRGDEAQLQQVFMNLMLNAVEAMSGSGELTVRTEIIGEDSGGRKMRVHISDTGAGISAEHLPRVFEPFFTTKKNGTGLGLAICQRVAQEHQGFIEVESEPGCGSTFIVSLAAD